VQSPSISQSVQVDCLRAAFRFAFFPMMRALRGLAGFRRLGAPHRFPFSLIL